MGVRHLRRGGPIPHRSRTWTKLCCAGTRSLTMAGPRTLTTSGVRWNNRYHVRELMHGGADVATKVHIRYIPHHDHETEVLDAVRW